MSALLSQHVSDDEVAFDARGQPVSCAQLCARVHALASELAFAAPSSVVVLMCNDRLHFATGLLAALSRGLVIALPPNGQAHTVHELARRLNAALLLHDRDDGRGFDLRTIQGSTRDQSSPTIADDARIALYTSGSTGEPQRHEKRLSQLLIEASALTEAFTLSRRRVVSLVPPHHIYGLLFGVLTPLCAGGSFSRSTPLQPSEVAALLRASAADVLVSVPPHLRALSESGLVPEMPRLHRAFSSGAPLDAKVSRILGSEGLVITEVFGSTETGGIAFREHSDAMWQALPGVTLSLGEEENLLVDSPWLAPEVARPFATSDRVSLEAEGFRHLGRTDSIVKVSGLRVDLREIELWLKREAGVRDARVFAMHSAGIRGVTLCAVVESDSAEVEGLRRALLRHLDPVTVPRRFRIVPALPRNAAGKVSRADLEALFLTWELPRSALPDDRMQITISEALGFFAGHFPEQPVLPGIAQLQFIALEAARERFPDLGALARVTRVKFKRLVVPGESMILSLERKSSLSVSYQLHVGEELASSGLLFFREGEA